MASSPFTLAIVGRPNVGKSTLFNRLSGKRQALVHDRPGVTRDWREAEAKLGDLHFRILDTAGLEEAPEDTLAGKIYRHTWAALEEADAVLLVIDGTAGVTPEDTRFAKALRKLGKPVILAVNKSDTKSAKSGVNDAYRLGFGEPVALSAEHNMGMNDLREALREHIERDDGAEEDEEDGDEENKPLHLAIVGRPNAGKSTLLNALLGKERSITGPQAGITRDTIAVDWEFGGKTIRLFDTAGMRKRAKVDDSVEKLAVMDARKAIQFAHVVVLLTDAEEALERQDLAIAGQVAEEGRALVIAVNKWDKVKDGKRLLQAIHERVEDKLPQVRGLPVLPISALEKRHLDKMMREVLHMHSVWNTRISTPKLNDWLQAAVDDNPPPLVKSKRLKFRYMTQIKTRPPTFALFASRGAESIPDHYLRYLSNSLRAAFDMPGVPLRWLLKKGKNPYENKKDQ